MSILPGRHIGATVLLLAVLIPVPGWAGEESQPRSPELQPRRPAALVPLYISFAGLQALDVHSTFAAVNAGGREVNPIVRSTIHSPAGLFLLKTGAAAGVVFISEKVWRRNRTAAVITMIGLNSAYLTIAASNYRSIKR